MNTVREAQVRLMPSATETAVCGISMNAIEVAA